MVIPTYNEEHRLGRCLGELHRLTCEPHWAEELEVIVVDDGSRDRTVEIARAQLPRFPWSQLLQLPWNLGKGAAVRMGVAAARGEVIAFMDADLATELSALTRSLEVLRDADMAIGSRAIPGAVVSGRSRTREILHRTFRSQVRFLTGVSATDPQCGFKVFRSEAAKALFAMERVDGYGFEVEILLLAQKLGYRVVEVPVHWQAVSGSHVRVLRDSVTILGDCLRVRLRYARKAPLAKRPMAPASIEAPEREPVR